MAEQRQAGQGEAAPGLCRCPGRGLCRLGCGGFRHALPPCCCCSFSSSPSSPVQPGRLNRRSTSAMAPAGSLWPVIWPCCAAQVGRWRLPKSPIRRRPGASPRCPATLRPAIRGGDPLAAFHPAAHSGGGWRAFARNPADLSRRNPAVRSRRPGAVFASAGKATCCRVRCAKLTTAASFSGSPSPRARPRITCA